MSHLWASITFVLSSHRRMIATVQFLFRFFFNVFFLLHHFIVCCRFMWFRLLFYSLLCSRQAAMCAYSNKTNILFCCLQAKKYNNKNTDTHTQAHKWFAWRFMDPNQINELNLNGIVLTNSVTRLLRDWTRAKGGTTAQKKINARSILNCNWLEQRQEKCMCVFDVSVLCIYLSMFECVCQCKPILWESCTLSAIRYSLFFSLHSIAFTDFTY